MEQKEMMSSKERLLDFCFRKHQEFDEKVWKNESFHNQEHAQINIQVAKNLIEKAKKNNCDDIFNLKKQLEKWDHGLSWSNFQDSVELAFAFHDLGNIGQWTKEGFAFFDRYQAKGSEKRSQKIAKKLMEEQGIDKRQQKLVCYLIGQTEIDWEGEKAPLFGRFMRACDQLSTNLLPDLDKRERLLIGLVKEESGKNEEQIPERFETFALLRSQKILPKEVGLDRFALLTGLKSSLETSID